MVNILCTESTKTFGNSSYKNLIGKAGLAAEPTLSIPMLLTGSLGVMASCMLLVMVFMSILYIIGIKFKV